MTHDSGNPFSGLDKTRFRKAENPKERPEPKKKHTAPEPDEADETALFMRVVGDVTPAREEDEDDFARLLAEHSPGGTAPAKKNTAKAAPSSRPVPDFTLPPEDADLFARAVSDVAPVRAGGRDLSPPPTAKERPQHADRALADFLAGKIEFALEHTDEFIEGHVLGLDPLVLAKLKAGHYSHEGHLDLHGQNMEQAFAAMTRFLKAAYQEGKRNVVLVTGRGRNSPGGDAVLRERVQSWLTRDPFKRVVLAFCTAQPKDGGAGALYLLLRKRKKSQGKIIWDRVPSMEELLL